MVDMVPVLSSTVREVGYDDESSELYVRFDNGVYAYTGVPPHVFTDLVSTPSAGGYFSSYVKTRYDYRKIS